MVLKTTRLALAGLALVAAGAAVLGTRTLRDLWRSTQADIREQAAGLVRPDSQLQSVCEEVRRKLPAHLAATRAALKQCGDDLAEQGRRLREEEATARLIDRDLSLLAEAVQTGRGASIHGTVLTPEAAKAEAIRLLGVRKRHEATMASRRRLLETLKKQQCKLQEGLASAEAAAAEFADLARAAQSKVDLLRLAKRAEQVAGTMGINQPLGQAPQGLAELNRRLDQRLQEVDERQRLDNLASRDPYATEARNARDTEELRKLFPPKDGQPQPVEKPER